MNTKLTHALLLLLVLLCFAAGGFAYPHLQDVIVSHWNAAGEANGFMSKFWGAFLLPLIMLVMYLVYIVIPLIDPLKKNLQSSRAYYNSVWIVIFIFFTYLFSLSMLWNLGNQFNFTLALVPGLAILWFFLGMFTQKIKRNWFFGIRTPWTLSSDVVWEKTHVFGGRLFEISGLITLIGFWFPNHIIWFIVIPIFLSTIASVVYSYIISA